MISRARCGAAAASTLLRIQPPTPERLQNLVIVVRTD